MILRYQGKLFLKEDAIDFLDEDEEVICLGDCCQEGDFEFIWHPSRRFQFLFSKHALTKPKNNGFGCSNLDVNSG